MAWHCFVIMSISPISLVARDGVDCIIRVVQEASELPHPFPQYKGSNPGTVVTELERQALLPSSILLAQGAVSKYTVGLFSRGELKEAGERLQTNEQSVSAKSGNFALTPTVIGCKATLDAELIDRRLASIRLSQDAKGSDPSPVPGPSRPELTFDIRADVGQIECRIRTPPPATPPLTPPLTPK